MLSSRCIAPCSWSKIGRAILSKYSSISTMGKP
jgi:hypothetical protein